MLAAADPAPPFTRLAIGDRHGPRHVAQRGTVVKETFVW